MAKNFDFVDVGELGMENSVRKYKGAKKWERKVNERETHVKPMSSKKSRVDYDEDYEYAY